MPQQAEGHCVELHAPPSCSSFPAVSPGTWPEEPGSSWQGRLGSVAPGDTGQSSWQTTRSQSERAGDAYFITLKAKVVWSVPEAPGRPQ